MSRSPVNPPHLLAPTRVKVVKAFCIAGVRMEPGSIVTVQFHVAMELKALGKVEILERL